MKKLKDITYKIYIDLHRDNNFYYWHTYFYDLGLSEHFDVFTSKLFKTKQAALKNCESWMKLNEFKYEVVE